MGTDITRVTINFGGLCLFVQRLQPANLAGLYVLMPRWPEHCLMVIPPVSATGGVPMLVPFDPAELDLSQWGVNGPPGVRPNNIADISAYGGGAKVDAKWLDGPRVDALAGRVKLPLSATLTPASSAGADVLVGNATKSITLAGQVSVDFGVLKGHQSITVGTTTIAPDANGSIEFELIAVPLAHVGIGLMRHPKGQVLSHLFAYYGLTNGTDVSLVRVAHDVLSSVEEPKPKLCASARIPFPEVAGNQPQNRYIDPYNCTVGIGDPP